MSELKPLRGYVLIEPIKDNEKTSSGVYLPETAKDKPMKGKIISLGKFPFAGDTDTVDPYELSAGDIVHYKKWANDEIKENNIEYVYVKYQDLLGVWEQ